MCAAAWDSVTQTTIKNSWYRTGILPPSMALDNDLVAVDPLSDDAEAEQELIVLINRMLHISDPLTVEEYIGGLDIGSVTNIGEASYESPYTVRIFFCRSFADHCRSLSIVNFKPR